MDASARILEEYDKEVPTDIDWKSDESPLTAADKKAHEAIQSGLTASFPEIPLMSEEGRDIPYAERSGWKKFWCVDPMDGTKEFIKKTGQFTVNIALIVGNKPVFGMIYAPAASLLYFAEQAEGAWKSETGSLSDAVQIHADHTYTRESELTIVASRDHAGPGVQKLFEEFPKAQTQSMGSSLKFCLIADGKADLYYRDVPTFEWDTAAAQCIVVEAGGSIVTDKGMPLRYNKENLRNPGLITVGKHGSGWISLIKNMV